MNGHVIVVDLGYGDAGKGTIVDWLCVTARRARRPVRAVVRFNGGAQAAHHVLAPSGTAHAFAQFGSGTFTPGTTTFLSRFMLVDPLALVAEAEHLACLGVPDPLSLIAVDRGALLTTPYHRAANQAREEARGGGRHGSCGLGIGETARYALAYPADAPRAGDLETPRVLLRKLTLLRDRLAVECELPGDTVLPAESAESVLPAASAGLATPAGPATFVASVPRPGDIVAVYRAVAGRVTLTGDGYLAGLLRQGPVVFEGAQGVLLDEWRGFHPYTTWSTTTFANAETLLRENQAADGATRLGVTRTYQTRHGPGPLPTEDPALGVTEPHNGSGHWQGPFRAGHLDAVALGYARRVTGGVDAVALTHLDTARRHEGRLRVCRGYRLGAGALTEIQPGPHQDLAYQESLTAVLAGARPVYDPGAVAAADWPGIVTEILHAPVAVRSAGPAVTDKTVTGNLAADVAVRPPLARSR